MYIGPQGIVHGTTITLLNALRKHCNNIENGGKLFVSSGLGGMSGAQPKAAKIAGLISVVAEINPKQANIRYSQGWVDEMYDDLSKLTKRIKLAKENKEIISFAYIGNVVDLWETLYEEKIIVDLGSDQTSLHNPFSGGYYPVGMSMQESNCMMSEQPELFREKVYESLRRQVSAINKHTERGMYFFDYGNAFLLEASRANASICDNYGNFIYPSYVQDIVGPMCFDYGFVPFRWICTSCSGKDLVITDKIASSVLEDIGRTAPVEISQQLKDNIRWINEAHKNNLVVGSQARILYADAEGRIKIAKAFNRKIKQGVISAPVVIGRDHHDVSGTDSPFRETSNIRDGSCFTADMSVHNVIGDAFRGATWVAIHNGGGVGWGEVINGGFGLVLDGTSQAEKRIENMLFWDVNNGIARRNWAGNTNAISTVKRAMKFEKNLNVLIPNIVENKIIEELFG